MKLIIIQSQVVLAQSGRMGREILSRWLLKLGVPIWEAKEWNALTHILQDLFDTTSHEQNLMHEHSTFNSLSKDEVELSVFIIVIDIGMLNLSTDIWKEQLNFLDTLYRRAKFAWILNHDTSNAIKIELRRRGHLLMVNGPLYKAKMIQIIEAVIKESSLEQSKRITMGTNGHECLPIDHLHTDTKSSYDSEISEINSTGINLIEETNQENFTLYGAASNSFPEPTEVHSERNKLCMNEMVPLTPSPNDNSNCDEKDIKKAEKNKNGQKALKGLHILLAEDTPILQRVATIMLEQMGAKVMVVGDGVQAVAALNIRHEVEKVKKSHDYPPYDLILMDCQVRMSFLTFQVLFYLYISTFVIAGRNTTTGTNMSSIYPSYSSHPFDMPADAKDGWLRSN